MSGVLRSQRMPPPDGRQLRSRRSVAKLSRVEFAGLAGLPLNCPQCGHPMRYLHAKTPDGQPLPASTQPPDSTIYVYACPHHGTMRLALSTPLQREP
jgi:hypothetical protein